MSESWQEKFVGALKGLGRVFHFKISHSSLLTASILSINLFIAFMMRLLPIRWGIYLNEFDSYYHYRSAAYILNNGVAAWYSWTDYMAFYPFGLHISQIAYLAVPFTEATLYIILKFMGLQVTLIQVAIFMPVFFGTLACLVIYFLTKDIAGKEAGLFASLFLALSASYISRTDLGFAKDESVCIITMLLFFLLFLRSIEKEKPFRNGLMYAVGAGLSLGYINTSWGASAYTVALTALLVFILILLRRYSTRLLLSYSVTYGIGLFATLAVPKLSFGYLTGTVGQIVVGVFILLCFCELFLHVKRPRDRVILTSSFFVIAIAGLFLIGTHASIGGKLLGVLNPLVRNAIVESVAEQQPGAWASLYYEWGILAFFIPLGVFFALRNPTDRNIFVVIFTVTSLYFASSMIRLTLIEAPAVCIVAAYGLAQILRPFVTIMKEAPVVLGRKMHLETHVGKQFSVAFIILMLILLIYPLNLPDMRNINQAYAPVTIANASTPVAAYIPDWINALAWMRLNTPQTAVVCSWWDYGEWIKELGNRTTLCDNTTENTTQIGTVGLMFMSNDTNAVKILKEYNVGYVVVFTTFYVNSNGQVVEYGWGDEGKWIWMLDIAKSVYPRDPILQNQSYYGNYSSSGAWQWNENGTQTVIYQLMQYASEQVVGVTSTVTFQTNDQGLPYFEKAYFSPGTGISISGTTVVVLVAVYKVNYG
jgi:dolichyl-diphosphooligosaccharide--protein glycosyltransferase